MNQTLFIVLKCFYLKRLSNEEHHKQSVIIYDILLILILNHFNYHSVNSAFILNKTML